MKIEDEINIINMRAKETKSYLEDIQSMIKNIWLQDLKELPKELLEQVEKEALFLDVTLSKIKGMVKERRDK